MRTVRRKEAEDSSFHSVCASLRQTSSKDRDSKGATVVKNSLSGDDRSRDHESSSVKGKKAQNPSLGSSYDA